MRRDHQLFKDHNVEIAVLGPEGPKEFQRFWEREKMPFTGLPDPEQIVLKRYRQEHRLLKLGRMPAQFIIDRQGIIRFAHYSSSMMDIPENREVLARVGKIKESKE